MEKNVTLLQYQLMDHTKSGGKYKAVRYLLPQNNPTVDLTSTSNYYHKPVHEYDDEEDH